MLLLGWTRSRCMGCRMGACASRKSGNGLVCEHEVWRGAAASKFVLLFVLPSDDLRGFPRFLWKITEASKTSVNTGFPCIFEKFE